MKFTKSEKEINAYIKNIKEIVFNIKDAETKSERENIIEEALGFLDELEEEVSRHFEDVGELENDLSDISDAIDNVISEAENIRNIVNKY